MPELWVKLKCPPLELSKVENNVEIKFDDFQNRNPIYQRRKWLWTWRFVDIMCSIFWLLSAKKLISPRNRVPSGFLDFLETFLYSKFVQEETFFWLVHQYRMLNYRFKAGLTKWPSNQVEKDQVTYLYSIFFLKETFAFQILVLLQYNRALLSGDSPKSIFIYPSDFDGCKWNSILFWWGCL